MKLVFLLEERSMQAALEGILPRLIPGVEFLCIPHEGKQDLEKSIPRKLRGWKDYKGTVFFVKLGGFLFPESVDFFTGICKLHITADLFENKM